MTNYSRGVSNLHGVYAIDEIMVDILSRLPPKSFMRFKCVRKSWLSLIQEDKLFFSLHNCRRSNSNKKILVHSLSKQRKSSFLTLDLFKGSNTELLPKIPYTCEGKQILGPVNGLLCFIDSSKHSVLIYNLCTKEESPWITSNLWKGINVLINRISPLFGFGFDPVTQKHKIVFVWLIKGYRRDDVNEAKYEVLTVGENTWRTTHQVLPDRRYGNKDPMYSDDCSIYWLLEDRDWLGQVLAFDVGKDKFKLIKHPYGMRFGKNEGFALEVDGHLALMERMMYDDQKKVTQMKLWTYIDQEEEEEGEKSSSKWIWEMIDFPFCTGKYESCYIESIPGTNLFTIIRLSEFDESPFVYFYDTKKKKFSEYGSLPRSKNQFSGYFRYPYTCRLSVLEESIYPVQTQLSAVGDDHNEMITTNLPPPFVVTPSNNEEWSNTRIVVSICYFLSLFSALYVFSK